MVKMGDIFPLNWANTALPHLFKVPILGNMSILTIGVKAFPHFSSRFVYIVVIWQYWARFNTGQWMWT